ncbi:MAG: hypothetical protein LBB13_03410 [Rickettsiales bacterium]|jgi:hypothetical protein|nr:hypothetical protein [Rickettsiales bacterium]
MEKVEIVKEKKRVIYRITFEDGDKIDGELTDIGSQDGDGESKSDYSMCEIRFPNGLIYRGAVRNARFDREGEYLFDKSSVKYEGDSGYGKTDESGIKSECAGVVLLGDLKNYHKNGSVANIIDNVSPPIYSGATSKVEKPSELKWLRVGENEHLVPIFYSDGLEIQFDKKFSEFLISSVKKRLEEEKTKTKTEGEAPMGNSGNENDEKFIKNRINEISLEIEKQINGLEGELDDYKKGHELGTIAHNSHKTYRDNWENDTLCGFGILRFANGSEYKGECKNGRQHGIGIYSSVYGSEYKGEWENGQRHGIGIYSYVDGSKYEGEWECGEKHGLFIVEKNCSGVPFFFRERYEGGHCVESVIMSQATYGADNSRRPLCRNTPKKTTKLPAWSVKSPVLTYYVYGNDPKF